MSFEFGFEDGYLRTLTGSELVVDQATDAYSRCRKGGNPRQAWSFSSQKLNMRAHARRCLRNSGLPFWGRSMRTIAIAGRLQRLPVRLTGPR